MRRYYGGYTHRYSEEQFSPELYRDTLQAREAWLQDSRAALEHQHLFDKTDVQVLQGLLKAHGQQATYAELQSMAYDLPHYSVRERSVLRKVVENTRFWDYLQAIDVNDSNRNGAIEAHLVPPVRATSVLRLSDLEEFEADVLWREKLQMADGSEKTGLNLRTFVDGRELAAAIYRASNVTGDVTFNWLTFGAELGWGTDEATIKAKLKAAAQESRLLLALKRDYERMYLTDLRSELLDELSGGELGEALTYHDTQGVDVLAYQVVQSPERAEVMLARFRPQIEAIGADNGLLAWSVGHETDDLARQRELYDHYQEAQALLTQWWALSSEQQANRSELRTKICQLTAQIVLGLEADQQADRYYDQSKTAAIDTVKTVAIVTTAAFVTVATAGTGAPLSGVLLAVAAGTASGTVVAFGGELAQQYGDYRGELKDLEIQQQVAQAQTAKCHCSGSPRSGL